MPIRFKCPHCKKPLVVKEQMAGKKAPCPACKKVLSVPAPVSAPADLEALAAAAFADDAPAAEKTPVAAPQAATPQGAAPQADGVPADGAPVAAAKPIEFNCPFCDAPLKYDADMGGKKAPCTNPECRRIVNVPKPISDKPKDWREVHKGPSAALANQPKQLEGAWGTTTDKAKVSQQALEEADAILIDEDEESAGIVRWLKRGLWVAGVGGALFLIVWLLNRAGENKAQREAIVLALEALDTKDHADAKKIPPAWAGALYRGAGEYYALKRNAFKANRYFAQARVQFAKITSVDADCFRIWLAKSQLVMGGTEEEAKLGTHIEWTPLKLEVNRTFRGIGAPDCRVAALREVGLVLVPKGKGELAATLRGELGDKEPARLNAQQCVITAAAKKDISKIPLKMPDLAKEVPNLEQRLAFAEGFARLGNFDQAAAFVDAKGRDADRLQAALGVAAVALADGKTAEAGSFFKKAGDLADDLEKAKSTNVTGWHTLELIRIGARVDSLDAARDRLRKLTPNFKGWGQLEIYLAELAQAKDRALANAVEEVGAKDSLARALAWEAWARHNTRLGYRNEMTEAANAQQDPAIRALIYLGIALGSADRDR
jgi:hypothetical protein